MTTAHVKPKFLVGRVVSENGWSGKTNMHTPSQPSRLKTLVLGVSLFGPWVVAMAMAMAMARPMVMVMAMSMASQRPFLPSHGLMLAGHGHGQALEHLAVLLVCGEKTESIQVRSSKIEDSIIEKSIT